MTFQVTQPVSGGAGSHTAASLTPDLPTQNLILPGKTRGSTSAKNVREHTACFLLVYSVMMGYRRSVHQPLMGNGHEGPL